jgi:Ca2+-binding RTX toxin-like protein
VAEIVLSNSAYIRHVSEFSSDGSYLFLWAQGIPYISVFDTQNFDAVGEIYLTQQFPLYLRGQNIEVSEDGTKLFLTTQYGFQVIDLEIAAPYTVPEPPISTDGDDIIYGTANDDTINALGGNDIVYGAAGDDTINGGDGNDLLRGDAGDDTLDGGFGVDWLRGGTGADVLNGWAGTDWADYITSSAGVTVNLLTNTATGGDAEGDTFLFIERVYGSSHDDHITGDNGVNYLRGWSGDDQLFGGIGNDYLQGGLGADALDGGDGSDWAYYISSSAGLTIDLQSPSFNTGEAVGDTYVSIENVVGSNHDDIIFGDSGNNFLRGANGDDSLAGGAGDDFLRGDLGADSLFGDAGNDWAYYAASNAGITINLTNAGAATGGHAAGDTFSSIERAFGSAFADSITGTFGANYLRGYFGNDSLVGGGGNDFLQGDAGADVLDGGAGLDWAYYASSTATGGITIHLGDSSQNTGEASGDSYISIENIVGSRYDDVITGDSGDNYLRGFLGDDILNGGAGNDTLRGEAGADIFVFEVGTGEDVVIDFVDSDDLLDFLDFGVADAMNNAAQVGDDVVFTFGADVITIQDITLADVADNVV